MLELREYGRIGERAWYDTLENGLQFVFVKRPGFKKKMAFFATDYGGADRRFLLDGVWYDTPAGVAHFLEHKMFDMENGENALTTLSARGAYANAFTSSNMTAYHFESVDMFDENFETLLKFVSTPYFTAQSIEKERGIIGQEIRMVEDEPDYALYYGLIKALYAHNPIREPVAGSVESIAEIDDRTLYACHKAFYAPSNMILVVVGDMEPQRVADMAGELLPCEKREKPVVDYGASEGDMPTVHRVERAMHVGAPLFYTGVKAAQGLRGKEGFRYELLAGISMSVMMGQASPLYNRLYSKGLINETFSFDFENSAGVSFAAFGGECDRPDEVIDQVFAEADRIGREGVGKELFDRRVKAVIGSSLRGLNSFDALCYNSAIAGFSGYDYLDSINVVEGITRDEVSKFIAETFRPERAATSVIKRQED